MITTKAISQNISQYKSFLIEADGKIKSTKLMGNIINTIQNTTITLDKNKSILSNNISKIDKMLGSLSSIKNDDDVIRLNKARNELNDCHKKTFPIFNNRKTQIKEAASLFVTTSDMTRNHITKGEAYKILEKNKKELMDCQQDIEKKLKEYTKTLSRLEKKQFNETQKSMKSASDKRNSKSSEQQLKDFFMIYQTNAGSYAINNALENRKQVNINADKILDEYTKIDNKLFEKDTGKKIASSIKASCKAIQEIMDNGLRIIKNTNSLPRDTYRGLKMNNTQLSNLIQSFKENPDTVYSPGKIYSTSTDRSIAKAFTRSLDYNTSVIVHVKGYSSCGVIVESGFEMKSTDGRSEKERVFHPDAKFIINSIEDTHNGVCHIHLEEVTNEVGENIKVVKLPC